MVIFSLGGLALQRHLRGRAVRCGTAVVPIGEEGPIVLDPFPRPGSRATVEGGRVRLWRDGVEVPDPGPGRRGRPGRVRWTDHELLRFTATTLHDWLVSPTTETPDGLVHHLTDHCSFGDVVVATRRRSYDRHGIPVLWADLVAAHLLPSSEEKSLN